MIVCSCNVFSDAQVRSAIAGAAQRPRVSRVYASLGCAAKCGRCAHTIKKIIDETGCCSMSSGCERHFSSKN
jgi:bacterioferritin-associated ferredoxin